MQLSTFRKNSNKLLGLLAVIMVLCWIFADVAEAQIYEMKWVNIGDMHSYFSEAGIGYNRFKNILPHKLTSSTETL